MFCVLVFLVLVSLVVMAFFAFMNLAGTTNRNDVEWLAINLDIACLFK